MPMYPSSINAHNHGVDVNLGDGWEIEVTDSRTTFVKYRGVDVVAIWLPYVGEREVSAASVTVPRLDEVEACAVEADSQVNYGVYGETDIDLAPYIAAIDKAKA